METVELKKIKHGKITAPVTGMTCASCVSRVEKTIGSIEGVKNVSVNLATEKATFDIDEKIASLAKIERAVEDSGYSIDLSSFRRSKEYSGTENEAAEINNYDKKLFSDFIIALIFTIPIFLISMGMMWKEFHTYFSISLDTTNKILFLLTLPVVLISGKRFYKIFIANLKHRTADMNSLVAIGTGSAFIYSTVVTFFPEIINGRSHSIHTYFETASVIITLILMGRLLESKAKRKTNQSIKRLIELQPKSILVKRNKLEQEIPLDELIVGDVVIRKPGSKIPADGLIITGFSTVDESMITGESLPVEKNINSKVIGGTINNFGSFEFEVTAIGDNSILGQIIKLVEETQGSKAPIQKLADKIASIFVPTIIIIALITFFGWLLFGSTSFSVALLNFIAVLIIACPCALGLATPTAIIVGTGKGAQKGLLIRNAETFEMTNKINTIIFDKTGTITTGKLKVKSVHTNFKTNTELIKLAASVEQYSEHPLAKAVVGYANESGIQIHKADSFESLTGFGIKGWLNENEILIGNQNMMNINSIDINNFTSEIDEFHSQGNTVVLVAINKELKGLIVLEDEIKNNAIEVISKLKEINLRTVLLTGDNLRSAKYISQKVGFDDYRAEVLPEEKYKIVSEYQESGKKVAMVGDGINDAPALVKSDVAIAMGTGTDVAIESGDVIIMSGNLNGVINAIELSKQTLLTIKQNLFWAFIYNIIGVPLAAFGILDPMIAALAMSLSSISVVSNSLRLKSKKI